MLNLALNIVLGCALNGTVGGMNGSLGLQEAAQSQTETVLTQTTTPAGQAPRQSVTITRSTVPTVRYFRGQAAGNAVQILDATQEEDRGIYVTFVEENIKPADIFARIRSTYHINLIYSPEAIPDVPVALSLYNVRLDDALVAIASVTSGYWTKVHDIYAFHHGNAPAGARDVLGSRNNSSVMFDTAFRTAYQPELHYDLQVAPQHPSVTFVPPPARVQDFSFPAQGTRVTVRPNVTYHLVHTPVLRVARFSDSGVTGLIKSLTPHQKNLMKKRGFLKLSDLTVRQKGMIGNVKGLKELKYSTTSGSITIKS